MNTDFLNKLGATGFTARVKRMSDGLLYDARKVYECLGLDIEPNWHLIFLLLKDKKQLTITQIKQHLGLSHPAVIKIINNMKKKDYLYSVTDTKDARKQLIRLSSKSIVELPSLEKNWQHIQKQISQFIDVEFLIKLSEIENALQEKSLYERCTEKVKEK